MSRVTLILVVLAVLLAGPCLASCTVDAGAPLSSLPIGQSYRVYDWIPIQIGTYTVYFLDYQDYIYYSDNDLQYIALLKFLQILAGVVQSICDAAPPQQITGNLEAGRATTGTGSASAYGSEPVAGAALANGNSLFAGVYANTLTTAVVSAGTGSSQTVGQYNVGPNAESVISSDFNGDGNADLAVSSFGNFSNDAGGNVAIFLGKGDGTFSAGAILNAGPTPEFMAAADFNGDGKVDLAVASLTAVSIKVGAISVLLGNGDGTFQEPASIPMQDVPSSVVALDLNGDGKTDLAVLNRNLGTVSILLGNGDGTFQAAVSYPAGKGTSTYLAATDVNGDGRPDLIVANQFSSGISFLLGNGDGSFQAPAEHVTGANPGAFALIPASDGMLLVTADAVSGNPILTPVSSNGVAASPQLYSLPQQATGVAAADLNGDGLPDMIAADGVVSVLLRTPGANFNAPVNYTLQSGSQAVAVVAGDLNGDGKNDVIVAGRPAGSSGNTAGTVDVALGNGDGTLGRQNSYAIGGPPGGAGGATASGVVTEDFNHDGKLDVAAGFQGAFDGSTPGGVSVLLGNGDGTLSPATNYPTGSFSALSIVAGDFNGDGKVDIAAGVGGAFFNYSTPGALALLIGKGDGTFQPAALTPVGSPSGTPTALAAADLNGDGKLDLVASVWSSTLSDTIVVLLGNGDGTFRQLAPISTPASGYAVAAVDLNGDGIPDIIVADCCGVSESVYLLGNGDGTFQSPQYFNSGASVMGFALADWNHNGANGLALVQQAGTVMAMESGVNPLVAGPPALSIASAHSGNFTQAQNNATYTITVSNQAGGATSGTVTVTEKPPTGLTLVSMTGTGWSCSFTSCTRADSLGTESSYPPITVTVNVASSAPSQVINQVSVSGGGSASASATDPTTINPASGRHPAFFTGEVSLGTGVYYLQFPDGNLFGYYNYVASSIFYHYDMGYEAFVPGSAADIYFYDFTSSHWWYTSATLFPYLYDFTLNNWLYYFPANNNPGHYTTNPRYFSNLTTGKIFTM